MEDDSKTTPASKSQFREYAGVLLAFIIVIGFMMIGFLIMLSSIWMDKAVEAPPDWSAAMLSLASAGLGFLIGKQTTTNSDH
jgi:hypothetical protein